MPHALQQDIGKREELGGQAIDDIVEAVLGSFGGVLGHVVREVIVVLDEETQKVRFHLHQIQLACTRPTQSSAHPPPSHSEVP